MNLKEYHSPIFSCSSNYLLTISNSKYCMTIQMKFVKVLAAWRGDNVTTKRLSVSRANQFDSSKPSLKSLAKT